VDRLDRADGKFRTFGFVDCSRIGPIRYDFRVGRLRRRVTGALEK